MVEHRDNALAKASSITRLSTPASAPTVPVIPIRFDNKVAIVTGASRGIGRVLAKGFAFAGAKTLFVARSEVELGALEREIGEAGHEGCALVADLVNPAGVESVFDTALRMYGAVDVLVNNFGVAGPIMPIEETPLADWNLTFAANLTSAFLAVRRAVPIMKGRGGGSIINIGSVNGKSPFANRSAYAATKTGMIGLTRTLALELGPHGVRVNAILPANVVGDRADDVLASIAKASGITVDEAKQQILERSPLRSAVAPESILNMALFLASEHSRHITGQDLNITAGMVMY